MLACDAHHGVSAFGFERDYFFRSIAHYERGDFEAALADARASVELRDGDAAAAVPLALELHEGNPSIQNAAMVAAALGAAGRHAEAVEWQTRVLGEAEAAGWPEQQLQRMRSDLELYRQRARGG